MKAVRMGRLTLLLKRNKPGRLSPWQNKETGLSRCGETVPKVLD